MPDTRPFLLPTKSSWLAALLCLAAFVLPVSAQALEQVALQLKFLHAFQFAGYYAAQEKGFYAQEGLDVDIRERIQGINNVEQVLKGEAQYGVADSGLLQDRLNGKPVVVLASIFQHNPLVYFTLQSSGIVSPYELTGKRVMDDFNNDSPLLAMFYETNIALDSIKRVKHSFNYDDLINHKVDAISGYLTDEVHYYQEKGIKINIIDPRNYGVDFLGDNLFTTEQELRQNPERAQRFLRASLKGWSYALQQPEELIQIILAKYNPGNRLSLDHLRFEARETAKMILAGTIPLGTTDLKRFQRIAETYQKMGLVSSKANWEGFIVGPKKAATLNLSEAEKAWLAAHPLVRVGIDPEFAPHEWVDANGEHIGLTADYIRLLEQCLGVKFEAIVDKSWPSILAMAKRGELDMLSDVNKTPDRERYLLFTEPYISYPVIIIDQGNSGFTGKLKRLNGKRVTVEEGYFMQETLARDYPGIQLVPAKNIQDALNKVRSGDADAYVGDAATSSYAVKREGFLELQFAGDTEYRSEHRMAATTANPELVSLIAKVLNDIPQAEKESIENRWLNIQADTGVKTKTLFKYAFPMLLLFILIISWNTHLRHEMRKRQKIELELRKNENNLRMAASVFANTQEGILITDKNSNIIDINNAFCKITGYSRKEVLGKNPKLFKSGLQNQELYTAMWQSINAQGYWSGELWNRRKNGDLFAEWITISAVYNTKGKVSHYIGTFTDITQIKEHELQLERIAHYDPLTGIPNRVLLADRMQQAIAQSKRENTYLAVGYLDLDGFKPVNDRFGHETGDLMLIEIAHRIKSTLREGDTIARLGGDEFVFLLLGLARPEECELTLHRLLDVINAPVALADQAVTVSASIGISIFPVDNTDPDTLLRHADQAMYQCKQAGKNRFHIYDPELDRQLHSQRTALDRIEKAIALQEFELFYQPKVDMHKGQVLGAEALIRWRDPERGLIIPEEFLPLLVGNELAVKLDTWVIDTALQQMQAWLADDLLLRVSVNIFARTLHSADFVMHLQAILERYPEVNPANFEMEILETEALEDSTHISQIIRDCQKLGIQFALDDFGTGYSSLTYLRRLPAQTLKIDRSFVRNMLEDAEDYAIVQSVIGLAQSFHRHVIAEGVESVQHGIALLELGCKHAQGAGIAKPMPADAIPAWITAWEVPAEWKKVVPPEKI